MHTCLHQIGQLCQGVYYRRPYSGGRSVLLSSKSFRRFHCSRNTWTSIQCPRLISENCLLTRSRVGCCNRWGRGSFHSAHRQCRGAVRHVVVKFRHRRNKPNRGFRTFLSDFSPLGKFLGCFLAPGWCRGLKPLLEQA